MGGDELRVWKRGAGVFLGSLFGRTRPPLLMKMGFYTVRIFSRRWKIILTVGSYHELLLKYLRTVKIIFTTSFTIIMLWHTTSNFYWIIGENGTPSIPNYKTFWLFWIHCFSYVSRYSTYLSVQQKLAMYFLKSQNERWDYYFILVCFNEAHYSIVSNSNVNKWSQNAYEENNILLYWGWSLHYPCVGLHGGASQIGVRGVYGREPPCLLGR